MRERFQATVEKAKELRARVRLRSQKRLEHRSEHPGLLRELADLVARTLRRRRHGDGRDQA